MESPHHKYMRLWLRSYRLPRPLSGIAVCIVYNPPDKSAQEQKDLTQYLMDTIDSVRTSFRCFGLVILSDFNNLDKADLISHQVLLESRSRSV